MSGAFYGSLVASASVFVAILTVIKHREFCSLDIGHNARHDADTYHQQSVVESVFFVLNWRYAQTLRAHAWFGQFRELVLKTAVRNVEADI